MNDWRTSRWAGRLILLVALGVLTGCLPASDTPTPALPAKQVLAPGYLGMYDVSYQQLDLAAQAGLNTVSTSPMSVEETLQYVRTAAALGLKVRAALPTSLLGASEEEVIAYVAAFANQPAVVLWYLPEEPETPSQHREWKQLYDRVTAGDPARRPVAVYLAGGASVSYFEQWADICDVFMAGAYPEFYRIPRAALFSRVKNASIAAGRRNMTVLATPQFFDLATIREATPSLTLPADPPTYPGHPSPVQTRADAYAALVAGAQGLDWYTFEWGVLVPDLWAGVRQTITELNALAPVFRESTAQPAVSARVLSGPAKVSSFPFMTEASIQARAWQHASGLYIVAVNLADEIVRARIDGFSPGGTKAVVLFEDRNLSLENGGLEDDFAPNEAHVYWIARQ